MDRRELRPVAGLEKAKTSTSPGVYALYRYGGRAYIGKAGVLQARIWKLTERMTDSALRRNVAEHLGIASAQAIKTRRCTPSPDEVKRVNAFVWSMEIAWVECATEQEARELEARMKLEYRPFLTKR